MRTPHRYLRRQRVERERLAAKGCTFQEDARGEFWTHQKLPGHMVSRRAAATLQAAWEVAQNAAEVA